MKQEKLTYILATFNIIVIVSAILLLTGCNKYNLEHISDPVDGYSVYQFRNRKGISKTIVDSVGRFSYGMDKITGEQLIKLSK